MKIKSMNLGEAVKLLRKERKMTQADLANAMHNYSIPNISRFEKGQQTLPEDRLQEVAAILGVKLSTLYAIAESDGKILEAKGGGDACLSSESTIPTLVSSDRWDMNFSPGPKIRRKVPLISSVKAGAWADIKEQLTEDEILRWVETTASVSQYSFALRVEGDSMTSPYGNKTLPEGSIVIVDPETQPHLGSVVVVRRSDENKATIKQLMFDGDTRYLKPLNPNYPILKMSKECLLVGTARQLIIDLE